MIQGTMIGIALLAVACAVGGWLLARVDDPRARSLRRCWHDYARGADVRALYWHHRREHVVCLYRAYRRSRT